MERTPDHIQVEPLRIRILAAGSIFISVLLVMNIAFIIGGFASCTETQSYVAGLALMAFFFYGVPAAAIGAVMASFAWAKCRSRRTVWAYLAVLGVALNALVIVTITMTFSSGGKSVSDFFGLFGIDLNCR